MARDSSFHTAGSLKRVYWLPHQEKFDKFYNSTEVQVGVALLIGANFLTNVVEKEFDPQGDKHPEVFDAFELAYNILFTIELAINMYAHWFWTFWISGWNVFDVIVVTIGIVNTLYTDLPPSLSLLRMMRAFRVFRLFKRVHSLNKIMVAIIHAIPGVANAFLILFIVMSIYAILAVELFQDVGKNCLEANSTDAWLESNRGFCVGDEYFGTFAKSLYTFFQVLTGESWSEAVARPVIWNFFDKPLYALGCGFFFVSYVLITAFVLTNVVVAVLLDKMVDPEVSNAAKPPAPAAEGEEAVVEEETEERTAEDLDNAINTVEQQVEQLISLSDSMSSEVGNFRDHMQTIRDQVVNAIQLSENRAVYTVDLRI